LSLIRSCLSGITGLYLSLDSCSDYLITVPKRGGCLTAFLVVMFVINPLVAIYYLFAGGTVLAAYPGAPAWTIPVLIVFSLINTGLAIGIWNWKRWGVYGFGVAVIGIFIVNMAIGVPILSALSGFVGLIIMIFLVRPVWEHMD
jgi:hypothetical protein